MLLINPASAGNAVKVLRINILKLINYEIRSERSGNKGFGRLEKILINERIQYNFINRMKP